ncbi:hypothetical protein GQR36_15000 [Enterococcus termitis]
MTKLYYLDRLFPNSHLREEDEDIIERIVDAVRAKEDLDIRHLAKINYTSPSSISRLAKRAGFNNFKEFIFFYRASLQTHPLILSKLFHM